MKAMREAFTLLAMAVEVKRKQLRVNVENHVTVVPPSLYIVCPPQRELKVLQHLQIKTLGSKR